MEVLYTYVLQLQNGKWYVGKTNDPFNRLLEHVNQSGSAWTRKYPPVQVHQVKPDASRFDEDNTTLEFMEKYGIDNVRGGGYVQVVLPAEQKQEILRRLASTNDACFNCGNAGHMVADCPGAFEVQSPDCARCGRDSHNASTCYAKTHLDGGPPQEAARKAPKKVPSAANRLTREASPVGCRRCGRDTHDESSCYAKTVAPGFSPPDARRGSEQKKQRFRGGGCFRCGRPGHWEGECYARTDVDGDPI